MQETMRGQLTRMYKSDASQNRGLHGKALTDAHSNAFDEVMDENKELKDSVGNIGKELHQRKKQAGKLLHICNEMSKTFSVFNALKCQMDEVVNGEIENQERPDPSEPMKLNNAQVSCSLNPVHVVGQRSTNTQSNYHLPDVEELDVENL